MPEVYGCQADPLESGSHWGLISSWWRLRPAIDFVLPGGLQNEIPQQPSV